VCGGSSMPSPNVILQSISLNGIDGFFNPSNWLKRDLSFCHKINFFNPYVHVIWCCKCLHLNEDYLIHKLKYLRSTTLGCKEEIRDKFFIMLTLSDTKGERPWVYVRILLKLVSSKQKLKCIFLEFSWKEVKCT